jgi:hypothetical protein
MKRRRAAKTDAGPSQPLELTRQQRLEELEQIADILLCIFSELSPEEQAKYLPQADEQQAA